MACALRIGTDVRQDVAELRGSYAPFACLAAAASLAGRDDARNDATPRRRPVVQPSPSTRRITPKLNESHPESHAITILIFTAVDVLVERLDGQGS